MERMRRIYKEDLGYYGQVSLRLATKKMSPEQWQQQYSFSVVSAISFNEVIASQVVEGAVNGVLYENFVREMITNVRLKPENTGRPIVILMDNARIHKYPLVIDTLKKLQVHVIFNSEYSPWLNPVE